MKRCVIIAGGDILNYDLIKSYITKNDFFVFCDSGLRHCKGLGIEPNLIVGDFDSYQQPASETETIKLPCEKDDTDSFFAVKECVARGFNDFLLLGMTGGRFDHTFGNISMLLWLFNNDKTALLADDICEMEIVGKISKFVPDSFPCFSLLALGGKAAEISVENAKYLLNGGVIEPDYQYGISNETIKGNKAKITVGEGRLLLVKNRKA